MNNYDVVEKVDVTNEETMLQSVFAKANLPPIHRYLAVHHIQVRTVFKRRTMSDATMTLGKRKDHGLRQIER